MNYFWRVSFFLVLFTSGVWSQMTLPINGRIQDRKIDPNASVEITFTINESREGGAILWSETQSLQLSNGWFQTSLGSDEPLPEDQDFTNDLWVGIAVNDAPELENRVLLSRAASAISAQSLRGQILTGTTVDDDILVKSLNGLKDNIILTVDSNLTLSLEGNKLNLGLSGLRLDHKVGVVGGNPDNSGSLDSKSFFIDDGVVAIKSSSLDSSLLSKNAVTSPKLKDRAVTNSKIAENAVKTENIALGAVETSDLASNAVTTV